MENLIKKIREKKAIIGVFGLGYVGLPLALRYSEVGNSVIGFDVDYSKVEKLNSGESSVLAVFAKLCSVKSSGKLNKRWKWGSSPSPN